MNFAEILGTSWLKLCNMLAKKKSKNDWTVRKSLVSEKNWSKMYFFLASNYPPKPLGEKAQNSQRKHKKNTSPPWIWAFNSVTHQFWWAKTCYFAHPIPRLWNHNLLHATTNQEAFGENSKTAEMGSTHVDHICSIWDYWFPILIKDFDQKHSQAPPNTSTTSKYGSGSGCYTHTAWKTVDICGFHTANKKRKTCSGCTQTWPLIWKQTVVKRPCWDITGVSPEKRQSTKTPSQQLWQHKTTQLTIKHTACCICIPSDLTHNSHLALVRKNFFYCVLGFIIIRRLSVNPQMRMFAARWVEQIPPRTFQNKLHRTTHADAPVFDRRKQPEPYVLLACPGRKHAWPTVDACWSPMLLHTGTPFRGPARGQAMKLTKR